MQATVELDQRTLDDLIEPIMKRAVDEIALASPFLGNMARYHLSWCDVDFNPIPTSSSNQGKRIRPRIALLAATALGGDPSAVAPVAAAIELLHNFTLVHDDVQDRSPLRRHRPTIWSLWGDAQAINVGDALFAASHLALFNAGNTVPRQSVQEIAIAFERMTIRIVAGQTMDLQNEGDTSISPDQYLTTIANKTAAIVRFAAWVGALSAGAPASNAQHLAEFGEATGLAFQIHDDMLGIWGETGQTGKTAGDDIKRRKVTLPILLLREFASSADCQVLDRLYSQVDVTSAEVKWVVDALDRTGIRVQVAQRVRHYHDLARAALEPVVLPDQNRAAAELYALIDSLATRAS